MKYRIYVALSILLTISLAGAALIGAPTEIVLLLAGGVILSLFLGLRSVVRPLDAVRNGYYLLQSQDFSSRLRETGQADADRVIMLFNRMMDTMKAERLKLMEQNLFLTKLIDVSPMGIAVCDFDDHIVETNPVYRRLQTPALEKILQSLAPEETRVVRLETSQIYRCSRLWFMDSGFRRTFYLIEVLTDEIIESERNMFRTIVRTIGHEVGNTIGPVNSVLDSLAEMHAGDVAVTDAIRGCRASCDNMVGFVRGYTDIVKLPEPRRVPVNLVDELTRMLPTLQRMAGVNIEVQLVTAPAKTMLCLDMMLMERAIINIVRNCVDSLTGSTGGKIIIASDGKRLSITDNGPGINEEVAHKLFTPFFSTKRPDRGLGLMLIADILRSHGASFSLHTDPATRLTTFAIRFP